MAKRRRQKSLGSATPEHKAAGATAARAALDAAYRARMLAAEGPESCDYAYESLLESGVALGESISHLEAIGAQSGLMHERATAEYNAAATRFKVRCVKK